MAVIKEVAKLADVSVGTVSKYLNNPDQLRAATRERVAAAIEKLQYRPNPLARSMRTGRTNTIAVFVPDILNPFFANAYHSIMVVAREKGIASSLFTTDNNPQIRDEEHLYALAQQVDAVVLFMLDNELLKYISLLLQQIKPVVLVSQNEEDYAQNSILVDLSGGMYLTASHLAAKGYKRIAYIGGPKENRISQKKHAGYLRALKEAGLEPFGEPVFNPSFEPIYGYQAAKKLYEATERPDSICAENDILAIGCMKHFQHSNVRIPEQIALTGFDNILLSIMCEPALTTVEIPAEDIAAAVMSLVSERLEKSGRKHKLRKIELKTELIIRGSTDKSAPDDMRL